jgi:hypothetical protein
MNRQPLPTTTSTFRVLVTDQLTPGLTGGDCRQYESPPHTEQQARALLAILVGTSTAEHPGPWRQAIAGGQRIVELRTGA